MLTAIFIVLVLIVVLGAVSVFFFVRHDSGTASASGRPAGTQAAASDKAILFNMGEFTTNLSEGSDMKYIKVAVVLRLDNNALTNEITAKQPILDDSLISLLNSETASDILTDRASLKANAMAALNGHLKTGKVIDIFFSDLVMQ